MGYGPRRKRGVDEPGSLMKSRDRGLEMVSLRLAQGSVGNQEMKKRSK